MCIVHCLSSTLQLLLYAPLPQKLFTTSAVNYYFQLLESTRLFVIQQNH